MGTQGFSVWTLAGVFAVLCCAPVARADTAPCDLLTQKEVSSAAGADVAAGSPIASTGCSWSGAKIMVTVSMQSQAMYNAAKRSAAPGMTNTPVTGIGDEAVFTGADGLCSLWVKKGSKVLLVRMYGMPAKDAQPKLKTLASTAVSRL